MKLQDLMMMDWILVENKPYRYLCPSLNNNNEIDDGIWIQDKDGKQYYTGIEDISPVPITTEILEKNEFFNEDGYNYHYSNDDKNLFVTFYPKNKNYTNGSYDYVTISRGCITIDELPIEHIHQLQHVLRLCGINENIIL